MGRTLQSTGSTIVYLHFHNNQPVVAMTRRSGDFNTRSLGENPSYSIILNQGSASTELDGSRRKSLFNPSKSHIQRVQAYKGASDDEDGGAGSSDNDVSTHIINVSPGELGKDESLGSEDSGECPPYEVSRSRRSVLSKTVFTNLLVKLTTIHRGFRQRSCYPILRRSSQCTEEFGQAQTT